MRSRLAQRDRNGCGFQKCLLEFDCGGDSCKKVAKAGTPRGGGGLPLDAEEGDGSAESRGRQVRGSRSQKTRICRYTGDRPVSGDERAGPGRARVRRLGRLGAKVIDPLRIADGAAICANSVASRTFRRTASSWAFPARSSPGPEAAIHLSRRADRRRDLPQIPSPEAFSAPNRSARSVRERQLEETTVHQRIKRTVTADGRYYAAAHPTWTAALNWVPENAHAGARFEPAT